MQLRKRRNEILVFALLMAGGATALVAQMDTGEDRSFAYSGFLAEGGVPTNLPHDVQFALFNSASADTSCLENDPASGCGIWAEAHTAVSMSAGNFAVMLGRGTGDALTDGMLNGEPLFLGIAVRATGVDPTFSVLGGLTELSAVPWAARAAAAKNYTVSGHLTAGSAAVGGQLTSATLNTGSITASTVTTTGDIRNTSASGQLGVSGDKVLNDTNNDSYLRLFTGYNSNTYANFAARDFFAAGNIAAAGDIAATGNIWQAGPTAQPEIRFASNGAPTFANCPNGQYVCSIGVAHQSGDGQYWTGARLQIRCCAL